MKTIFAILKTLVGVALFPLVFSLTIIGLMAAVGGDVEGGNKLADLGEKMLGKKGEYPD